MSNFPTAMKLGKFNNGVETLSQKKEKKKKRGKFNNGNYNLISYPFLTKFG